jgi:hypothetical protein
MNGYHKENFKSFLLFFLCGVVVGAALFGLGRIIYTVAWNTRIVDYRQAIAASMKYAEDHNSMEVTIDDGEPVHVRFDRVENLHHYLVNYPLLLPVRKVKAEAGIAVIDCGDGSTLGVREAQARQLQLYYRTPEGKLYRYGLQYHTSHDDWDAILRLVSGEYLPG